MIKENLKHINQRINHAHRTIKKSAETITLVAVSKHHDADKIREAYSIGQIDFGENYLNEALDKQIELNELPITWHFIGHIQSNKTRKIAENFTWVHTVDSLKIAQRLSNQRPKHQPPLNICLQINIDNEHSKSGLPDNEETLLKLSREIVVLPNIKLRGLMCIPAPKNNREEEKKSFLRMKQLHTYLNDHHIPLDTLSMGMSNDLETAIACGSTMIRIGTAIFGSRN